MLHHECRRGSDKRDKQRAEHRNHPAFELIKASLRFLSRNCELLAVLRLRRVEFAVDFSTHLREFASAICCRTARLAPARTARGSRLSSLLSNPPRTCANCSRFSACAASRCSWWPESTRLTNFTSDVDWGSLNPPCTSSSTISGNSWSCGFMSIRPGFELECAIISASN